MSTRRHSRRSPFPNVNAVASALSARYGDYSHENKANPLRELIYIILSVQTNETLYRSSYAKLMSAFPRFRNLANAKEDEIAAVVAHGGLSHQKARTIRAILVQLKSDFGRPTLWPLKKMSDNECEEYLQLLPGVGRKTARCVMMYSLDREVFPVDSNCWRICRRLGWVRATRPDKSCSPGDMDRVQVGIPPNLRRNLHVNLVSHGRESCLTSHPRCDGCCIQRFCPMGSKVRRGL